MALGSNEPGIHAAVVRRREDRVRDPERPLGRKTMEPGIPRKTTAKARATAPTMAAVAFARRFPMSRVADVPGVGRSERPRKDGGGVEPRRSRAKLADGELTPPLRGRTDAGPTCGNRRITALLDRRRGGRPLSPIDCVPHILGRLNAAAGHGPPGRPDP